ncbi:hypothetical protein QCA50_014347 [Cerrena zonata]|uniref:Uncharacterized protein n=1 Tax=Cerrena zonata TaxID=2478898 RepID=A0AAW0FTC7_9APHY
MFFFVKQDTLRFKPLPNGAPRPPFPAYPSSPSTKECDTCWLCPLGIACATCPICFGVEDTPGPIYATVLTEDPINELTGLPDTDAKRCIHGPALCGYGVCNYLRPRSLTDEIDRSVSHLSLGSSGATRGTCSTAPTRSATILYIPNDPRSSIYDMFPIPIGNRSPVIPATPNTPHLDRRCTFLDFPPQRDSAACTCKLCRRARLNNAKLSKENVPRPGRSQYRHDQVAHEQMDSFFPPGSSSRPDIKGPKRLQRLSQRDATHRCPRVARHRYDRIAPMLKEGISSLRRAVKSFTSRVMRWSADRKEKSKPRGYVALDNDDGVKGSL